MVVQKLRISRSLAVLVASVLCLGSHFIAAATAAQLTPVRAAYIPVVSWLPAWVAKDKGFFEKNGLDVTLSVTQNLSVLPGTLGRQFDFAPSTPADQLKAGNVDAVESLEPFAGQLLAAGNRSLGDPLLSVSDEVLYTFWISDRTWAVNNPAVIAAWVASLNQAKEFMDANPQEARAILAKYTKLPEAVVQKIPFVTYRFSLDPRDFAVWVNVLKDLGQITRSVDENSLVIKVK